MHERNPNDLKRGILLKGNILAGCMDGDLNGVRQSVYICLMGK